MNLFFLLKHGGKTMVNKRFYLGILVMTLVFGMTVLGNLEAQTGNSQETLYSIGDIGPAKGLIFYDKGVFSNGWRYLEAAPLETEFKVQWGGYKQDISGTSPMVGRGKQNTEIIIERLILLGDLGKAAQLCANLKFEGFSDWFLPSKEELVLMQKILKRNNLGDFSNNMYWSSTQFSKDQAYYINFRSGKDDMSHKDQVRSVRAIRAF